MKHTTTFSTRFVLLSAVFCCNLSLDAAVPVKSRWTNLCNLAHNQRLTLTVNDPQAKKISGACMSVKEDEISIQTENGSVTVSRSSVKRITMRGPRTHHALRELVRTLLEGVNFSVEALVSPHPIIGVLAFPATVAWGAASLPFDALGDLSALLGFGREITIQLI
jgi:hypothetical protein